MYGHIINILLTDGTVIFPNNPFYDTLMMIVVFASQLNVGRNVQAY